MCAQILAPAANVDAVDLDALDAYLMSDRSPADCMLLSDLDGFLTGIAIGPELVLPSEWLSHVWRGEAPEFADEDEAQAILGAIMGRYNEILRQVADDAVEPIFWQGRDDVVIAMDWAEGFMEAIMLRAEAWEKLFKSKRHNDLLYPILALCSDENGAPLLPLPEGAEDEMFDQAPDFIPEVVMEIAAYWGRAERKPRSPSLAASRDPVRAAKVGRNDPCPCGSGKKFKKCCGLSGQDREH